MIYKTPKGTELPVMDLKGKPYMQVAYRVQWFREERPDWSIETEYKTLTDVMAISKATIKDEQGRIRSTSHKVEYADSFQDFAEKAETGSIGRALALIGYGTQFAVDLDEGDRIVDAPLEKKTIPSIASNERWQQTNESPTSSPNNSGEYKVTFGKHKGRKISDFSMADFESYATYLLESSARDGKSPSKGAQEFINAGREYFTNPPNFEDSFPV
jgi:hypothetical protein